MIHELIKTPYITVAEAERRLVVSNPTARAAVHALVVAGLLEEVGRRTWRRLYVACPVLEAITTPVERL